LRFGLGVLAALVAIGYLFATGAISTNLVLNRSVEAEGGAETAPQDWSPSGNGAEWNTTYARSGSRSLRITVNNSSVEWTGKVKPVSEGINYQATAFFTGQIDAGQFLLAVRWFSDSEGLTPIVESNLTIPVGKYPQWSELQGDFSAPAGTKSCEIVFRAVDASGDLYADDFAFRQTESATKLLNSGSLAIIIYLLSYYYIRYKFRPLLQKTHKLFTAGIGIYFLAWIVVWALLYTLIAGA
jgi:hypothetical protein